MQVATIGSITVAFKANLEELQSGVEDALDLFDDLSESIEEISEKLDSAASKTITVKAAADTKELTKASKDIDDLKGKAEKGDAKVKVSGDADDLVKSLAASSSAWDQVNLAVREQAKELGERFSGMGATASTAFKAVGSAANGVAAVLDGTRTSVDGLVVGIGRLTVAADKVGELTSSLAGEAEVFLQYVGGIGTVFAAFTGSVAAAASTVAGLAAAFTFAVVRAVVFQGVLGLIRIATAGLSEEARAFAAGWGAVIAGIVSTAAAGAAAAAAFSIMSSSLSATSSSASFLSGVLTGLSGIANQAFTAVANNLQSISLLFGVASVASGKYSDSLSRIGAEAESIRNMADRFGQTTQQMQVLAFAADSAGVSMGQLAKASQVFYTNVSKVKIGQLNVDTVQEAKFAFDRLGISISDLRNKKPQEVFALVSGKLLEVEDAGDRAAIAFDLFGKQATNILPALKGLKEAASDAGRLGTAMSDTDFTMFEGVDASFDRLKQASANLSGAMLVAFAPLQTGFNNLLAEIQGGLVAAIGPLRTVMAQATQPLQVMFELTGRVINILLRAVGVVTTFIAAMLDAAAIGPAWVAIGDVIEGVLGYLETAIDYAQRVASAFASEMNPALEESAGLMDKLAFAAKSFAYIILSGGVASAVMQTFGVSASAAFTKFAAGLLKINVASVFTGIIKLIKLLTFDVTVFATRWVASMIVAGVSSLASLLTPFMVTVASVITGNSAMAVSATATGWAMAAAWIIGTLGLAAIVVAIIAVIQNFSTLYDWFSDFGNNIGRLFTWDGLAEAAVAVTLAIQNAFMTLFNWIGGFFSGIIQNIVMAVNGIEMPEKINASTSSVADVVASRKANQQAQFDAAISAADMVGASTANIEMPNEDVDQLSTMLTGAREEMISLSMEATRFGDAGSKAFLAARADFDKLQQQLADGNIAVSIIIDENGVKRSETQLEAFERRSREIRNRVQENLNLADVLSPEALQKSADDTREAIRGAVQAAVDIYKGQDLGSDLTTSRFFPSSDAIRQQAAEFSQAYADELKDIEARLQRGEFGSGQSALEAARNQKDAAKTKFERNMKKVDADVSFASDIRKALEDAFLSPVEKFKKELKQIQDNKSLTEQEKSLATVMAQKQMVEGTFGKSAGSSLRDKEQMFAEASAQDQFGRNAFMSAEGSREAGDARQSAERNKLDIERRKAVGLDATASQQLKAGADNIADIFGVAGLSIEEISKTLSPEQFAEYQEAMKKNVIAVKESLGVEQSGASKLAESRARLDKALQDGVISQDEYTKATKKQKDALLQSLGISKSPSQEFEDAVARIRENAEALTPDELAKGLKEAKDKLLQSLGIPKNPADAAAEAMNKLNEAFRKGQISADEFAAGALQAKNSLLQSLGIPLDPVAQLGQRMNQLQDAFAKGLISQEEFTRGQEEARRSMLPGSEEESPVKKFTRDMDAVRRAESQGLISEEDAGQRRLNLQAELQENLKPALDRLAPDRRAVESSDVRSKSGVDTFFRILRGNDNPSLKAQLEIARNTRLLAEASAEPEAAPVLANIQGR